MSTWIATFADGSTEILEGLDFAGATTMATAVASESQRVLFSLVVVPSPAAVSALEDRIATLVTLGLTQEEAEAVAAAGMRALLVELGAGE